MAGGGEGEKGGGADCQGADNECPLSPLLLLNPYLSRNNLASHVVPLIAGHSGIILLSPLLSVFCGSLSPSSAWAWAIPLVAGNGPNSSIIIILKSPNITSHFLYILDNWALHPSDLLVVVRQSVEVRKHHKSDVRNSAM